MRGSAAALAALVGDPVEQVFAFKAPLLNRILDNPEDPERREVVLDLGGASQALLDRLSASRPCRIEIADFVHSGGLAEIERLEAIEDSDQPGSGNPIGFGDPSWIQDLLPKANEERLALILCWDLPNYLSLRALELFIDGLSNRIAPRCRLHMLIGYSKREMAAMPGRYIPGADGNLTQILSSEELTEAPRYSPEHLNSALGGFSYERGVLLANGMQEFVYAWPDEPDVEQRPY